MPPVPYAPEVERLLEREPETVAEITRVAPDPAFVDRTPRLSAPTSRAAQDHRQRQNGVAPAEPRRLTEVPD